MTFHVNFLKLIEWCKQSGSYRFIGRHRCQVMDDGNPLEMDYDDRDADLWANND